MSKRVHLTLTEAQARRLRDAAYGDAVRADDDDQPAAADRHRALGEALQEALWRASDRRAVLLTVPQLREALEALDRHLVGLEGAGERGLRSRITAGSHALRAMRQALAGPGFPSGMVQP